MAARVIAAPTLARLVLLSGARLDLVLTDLHMPGLSGDALARSVGERWPSRET